MQKAQPHVLQYAGTHMKRWTLPALALLILLVLSLSSSFWGSAYYKFVDNDPDRGAKASPTPDHLGDQFSKVVYLDQNWKASDSLWYYNIDQGSDLLPFDFYLYLEQVGSTELFRADDNMNRYRYLPQKQTRSNPDALPVGMVRDTYKGKQYMGFTCAACHSSQINYKGTGIRIDGGPGEADMDTFLKDMAASFTATLNDEAKKKRFVNHVLSRKNYRTDAEVLADLATYELRLRAYNFFNASYVEDDDGNLTPVPYGYARLDAFGRIYNRVLEHVINPQALREVLIGALGKEEANSLLGSMTPVLTQKSRDHLIERLMTILVNRNKESGSGRLEQLRAQIFNSPNAPVSYPFLWDIPQHDFVQWNGIGANAGAGPIGRNSGEVIGVFASLDWAEKEGWTISSVLGGQGFGKQHISFESSVKVHNLKQIEDRLGELQSPQWKDAATVAGLPPIKEDQAILGKRLFEEHCVACHANIDRTSPDRRIVAHMDKLEEVKTDPTMATNSVEYAGFSGILRNWYVGLDPGSILLNVKAPVAALLTKATQNVVATPDPDKWFFTRGADWAIDLIDEISSNKIKPSIKAGAYTPDTTADPLASLKAYKGRSLNGIWATAPYLHNGSVPTLYDLLLPADPQNGDDPKAVYRPKKFMVGSREFDPDKVGFRHDGYKGFEFDTTLPGNSNVGHEYATRKLAEPERLALLEYLKSL